VVLAFVPRWLQRQFPRAPREFTVDAVTDTLVRDYLARPQQFDPRAGTLLSWLELGAKRNLQNRLQAETRLQARERKFAEERVISVAPEAEDDQRREKMRRLLKSVCQPYEFQAALLYMAGERRTEAIAAALGLSTLPEAQQRRESKCFTDRLKKRIVRSLRELQWMRSNSGFRCGSKQ
jgi:hypothetical protein